MGINILAMPSSGIHNVPKKPKSIHISASSSLTPCRTKSEFSNCTFIFLSTAETLASVSTIMRSIYMPSFISKPPGIINLTTISVMTISRSSKLSAFILNLFNKIVPTLPDKFSPPTVIFVPSCI